MQEIQDRLLLRIQEKSARIGVFGLGYVGLPLALRFVDAGFHVVGFDTDRDKVARLNQGQSYLGYIRGEAIAAARKEGRFEATGDWQRAHDIDALILCLPTPLGEHQEPDISFIVHTITYLGRHLRQGQLICLESTTYPGTTEEEIRPRLESLGFKVGADVFLVYSPERVDPGNQRFALRDIPKIVGGTTPACLELGTALYRAIIDQIVPVSTTAVAELAKLLENIYRAVNISLVNELKMLADRMGIDIWEVIDAAATKPFGFTPFYPGPGLGGHCIPIDPFYLTWKARAFGVQTRFIELAGEINSAMPQWLAGKITDALNQLGKPVRGARILVLGIAYKKNIDDSRESPAVGLMEVLRAKGADLAYADPHIPIFPVMRRHKFELRSIDVNVENLAKMDCIVLTTDHDAFDYELIQKHARLILDTRGRYRAKLPNVINC